MNKTSTLSIVALSIMSLVSLLFPSTPLRGETGSRDGREALLYYKNHLGFEKMEAVLEKQGIVSASYFHVPLSTLKSSQSLLTEIFSVRKQKNSKSHCTAGKYTHLVKVNRKKFVESGCMDDSRFEHVNGAFQELIQRMSMSP